MAARKAEMLGAAKAGAPQAFLARVVRAARLAHVATNVGRVVCRIGR